MKKEKMTKDELIFEINDLNEKIESYEAKCKAQSDYCEEKEKELILLKHLYNEYVPVMEENKRLRNDIRMMECRIVELQDLCDRQQKIIDSRCI